MSKNRLIGLAVAGALGIGAVATGLFFLTHELVSDTEHMGPSGRALRDPFWAATLLLREMDVPTFPRYGLGQLPPPDSDAVVIVLANDYEHRASLSDRLATWAEQGGHVVIAPGNPEPFDWSNAWDDDAVTYTAEDIDPLLGRFGIALEHDGDQHWGSPMVVELERENQTDNGTVEALVTSARQGVSSEYCAAVVGSVDPDPDTTYEAPARTQVRASCQWAKGRVTAVSSTDLFENTYLRDDRGDNAAFFWDTVAPDGPPSHAILVLRGDAPSFFALLWARGWPLLLSLAAALVGWAAWQGQRFGPVLDQRVEARRSMLEHLDAAGSLLWRHHRLRGLSAAMRRAVRSRLARRSPAIAHLQGQALAQAVAELTGRPVDTIRQVLVEPPPRDRQAFVEMVQTLQQIWRDASPVPTGSPT